MDRLKLEKIKARRNSYFKKQLIRNATYFEHVAKRKLKEAGIRFLFQKGFYCLEGQYKGFHCIVDFYLPKPNKIVIEIDGEYHKMQFGKDRYRDNYLTFVRGFRVIRIENKDVHRIIEIISPHLILRSQRRIILSKPGIK